MISDSLKYFVQRTKLGKNLPIYTEYRNGGNQCFTLIKKVSGDCETLSEDLANYFEAETDKDGSKVKEKVNNNNKNKNARIRNISLNSTVKDKWRIRSEFGHIWVNGNHTGVIRKFLESKGF